MGESATARALATDYRTAQLSPEDGAMLAYAVRLTLEPHGIDQDDVQALREHGFTDTAILDICQVTAYYNYVNRLADGLGVELEDHWQKADLLVDRDVFEARTGRGRR